MDAIRMHLNWLSNNSRNMTETQKEEIYGLLNSLKNQLASRMGASGSTNLDQQLHELSKIIARTKVQNEKTCNEIEDKIDSKNASLESKINNVSNIVSKETGYIHGKIDSIAKNYDEQIKMLQDQIEKLKNENDQKQQEEKKVKNEDIDQLTKELNDLMNGFDPESCIKTPNSNPTQPKGPPPPYEPYPLMAPNQNMPHFPPCPPPLLYPMPSPSPMVPPFRYNYPFPNYPPQPPCDQNRNVYRFSGNSNPGPSSNFARGGGHQTSRFNKPFTRTNDGKPDFNSKKKYCDPHWKKFDHKNRDHGNKNEPSKSANDKPYHRTASRDQQSGHDHCRSNISNPVKNDADRRHKRYQQFGKNRSQNQDDGCDSDTSTSSHVSSSIPQQKVLHSGPSKTTTSKSSHSSSMNKNASSHSQKKNDNVGGDTSKVVHHRKESGNKSGHQTHLKTASTSKNSAQVIKQGDNSDLMKMKYPSKVEALRNEVDIKKRFDLPVTCLGKKNGVPVSRVVRCLADIYRFEEEFGSCQVVRF